MSATQQYRITFSSARDGGGGTCFIDAATEAAALKFFAVAFPNYVVVSIKLEPVDPCAQYQRKAGP